MTGSLSDLDPFIFKDVSFLGEDPLKLFFKIDAEGIFHVFNSQKKWIADGKIGQSVQVQNARLTLQNVPKNIKADRLYRLTIDPWMQAVAKVRKNLSVRPNKMDKNILQLSYQNRDRHLSSAIVNQVMQSYQKYLKRENEELCQSQLAYLQERQQQLVKEFDLSLSEHVAYLTDNLDKDGFIGFAQELETLSEPKNQYISKLFSVDVELKRFLSFKEPGLGDSIAIDAQPWDKNSIPKQSISKRKKKENIDFSSLKDIQNKNFDQLQRVDLEEKRIAGTSIQPLISEIEQSADQNDFKGLSLDTAQKLMVEYTQQRDKMQAEMKELVYLRDRLISPDFELSSLGTVINEPVTNELIQKASAIALQLQDNDNRSEREQERLLESLNTQKSFLSQHIFQIVELKKLRIQLIENKIYSLQQSIVSLLKSEKELLKQKLQEINNKMGDLPDKWRRESLLMLKKEIGSMMIHAVSQLTETKFLGQNIFQVTSKPLDSAFPPTNPKTPMMLFWSCVGAIIGALGFYFLILCRTLLRGLPVSYQNLKLSGLPVSGSFSRYCDTNLEQMRESDLETLRHTAEFLSCHLKKGEALTVVGIGGKHPDYSKGLAEILALRGIKTLIIRYKFDQVVHPEDQPGLWQYLNGTLNQVPIRSGSHYDYLPSGGTTRHASDLVSCPKLIELLCDLKKKYDLIFLQTSADAAKAEGLAYLKIADAAVVSVQQEVKEDLAVFCDWARKKGKDCATFIYVEEFNF
jgi:hypothetical protein